MRISAIAVVAHRREDRARGGVAAPERVELAVEAGLVFDVGDVHGAPCLKLRIKWRLAARVQAAAPAI